MKRETVDASSKGELKTASSKDQDMRPRVFIGMPVFNGCPYIEAALQSLTTQTFQDWQLLIADNCSTDDTASVCQRFVDADNRISYVRHEKNEGAAYNFRYVLDAADTEFFMWAAHDDVFLPHHLEQLMRVHATADYLLVAARPDHVELRTGRTFLMKKIPEDIFGLSAQKNFIRFMQLHHWWYAKACMIYGLFQRKRMPSFDHIPDDYAMQTVGADLLYIYHVLASGKCAYVADISWRRGERFYLSGDPSAFKAMTWLRKQAGRASFQYSRWSGRSDPAGIANAIDRYCSLLGAVWDTAFQTRSSEFKSALRKSRCEIIDLLMPLPF